MVNRNVPDLKTRNLAQQLIGSNEAAGAVPAFNKSALSGVFEKLRRALSIVLGLNGFTALVARALALTKTEEPRLAHLEVNPDGSIEGLSEIPLDAGVALTAHLLWLLNLFIGEALVSQILLGVSPPSALSKPAPFGEGQNESTG